MRYIKEKIKAGVLDLKQIPVSTLLQWTEENESRDDLDLLYCEIFYRDNTGYNTGLKGRRA